MAKSIQIYNISITIYKEDTNFWDDYFTLKKPLPHKNRFSVFFSKYFFSS
jgi:hypothetical protein